MQIIKIDGESARSVIDSLSSLDLAGVYSLRVAFDEDSVKFKVNEGAWSPPYGAVDSS
jgi:hypothetical protein